MAAMMTTMLAASAFESTPASSAFSSSSLGCGWSRCVSNCTDTPGGGQVYPCGPSHPLCPHSPKKPMFSFHLADPTCDINDPNGPFYDPVHGLYHNFYQIHVAEDQGGAGDGPDWGHWVSKDFVRWAQLPVAIWNDRYYDNSAIYSGSATIVDGRPAIMYSGKCNGKDARAKTVCNDGKGGFTYVLVVPKNASDPMYTEWVKDGSVGGMPFHNPILNQTGDDPSTAWRTAHGEWRLIGNQLCGGPKGGNPLYGSMDFVKWYKIGCSTMMAGDCPSFFPLPSLTPGSEHYVSHHLRSAPLPTHVHKSGGPGTAGLNGTSGDQTQVGVWEEGAPGVMGTWTVTAGSVTQFLDRGKTHASKDFHDPVHKRQIMWVWGTLASGIQTVPRDMTYHPGIKRIVYAPVAEMRKLRTGLIDSASGRGIGPGQPLILKASTTCDIELAFAMPTKDSSIVVTLTESSTATINFTAPTGYPSRLGAGGAIRDPWMVSVGWAQGGAAYHDKLPMLPDDPSLTLRLFLDRHVAEAFFMGGRVVLTSDLLYLTPGSVTVSATSRVTLNAAVVHSMGDIHTSVDEVLAAHVDHDH